MPAEEKSPYGIPTPNQARGPHDDSVTPSDLKVKLAEQKLIVDWKDGKRSEFSLDELRRICPCASCRTERDQYAQPSPTAPPLNKGGIGGVLPSPLDKGGTGGVSLSPLDKGGQRGVTSTPLRILKKDPTGVRVVSAKLVGAYAIQFDWSDGHNTGIFDFRFLRSLGT